jgi:hypothetical protein
MYIRNEFGLWWEDHPLFNHPDLQDQEPDDVSSYLIEQLWLFLQNEK